MCSTLLGKKHYAISWTGKMRYLGISLIINIKCSIKFNSLAVAKRFSIVRLTVFFGKIRRFDFKEITLQLIKKNAFVLWCID